MNSSPNIPPAGLRPQLINDRHSPETILLVEDDDLLCELTVRVLRKGGYPVVEAHDAEAALRVVEEQVLAVDLLVSDISLPKVTGIQLFENLRKTNPDLKAVFLSGYTSEQIQASLPKDTIFLEKPYESIALVEAVQKILG